MALSRGTIAEKLHHSEKKSRIGLSLRMSMIQHPVLVGDERQQTEVIVKRFQRGIHLFIIPRGEDGAGNVIPDGEGKERLGDILAGVNASLEFAPRLINVQKGGV